MHRIVTFAQNQGERRIQSNNQRGYLANMPRGNCGRSPHTAAIYVATADIREVYSVLMLVVELRRAAGATAYPIHFNHGLPWPAEFIVRIVYRSSSITESK